MECAFVEKDDKNESHVLEGGRGQEDGEGKGSVIRKYPQLMRYRGEGGTRQEKTK